MFTGLKVQKAGEKSSIQKADHLIKYSRNTFITSSSYSGQRSVKNQIQLKNHIPKMGNHKEQITANALMKHTLYL